MSEPSKEFSHYDHFEPQVAASIERRQAEKKILSDEQVIEVMEQRCKSDPIFSSNATSFWAQADTAIANWAAKQRPALKNFEVHHMKMRNYPADTSSTRYSALAGLLF